MTETSEKERTLPNKNIQIILESRVDITHIPREREWERESCVCERINEKRPFIIWMVSVVDCQNYVHFEPTLTSLGKKMSPFFFFRLNYYTNYPRTCCHENIHIFSKLQYYFNKVLFKGDLSSVLENWLILNLALIVQLIIHWLILNEDISCTHEGQLKQNWGWLEVKGIGRTPTMDEVQVRTLLLNFFISVAEPLVEEKYENDE